MLNLDSEIQELEKLSEVLNSSMSKMEQEVQKIQGKDKGIIIDYMNSLKDTIKNGGDIKKEIEKLKNYAGNR